LSVTTAVILIVLLVLWLKSTNVLGVPAEKAGGLFAASPRHAQKRHCGLSASNKVH